MSKVFHRFLLVASLILSALWAAGGAAAAGPEEIPGTGEGLDLFRALSRAFLDAGGAPKTLFPDSIGSGGGVKAVLDGKAHVARVARRLKSAEVEAGLLYTPLVTAPIVFAAHHTGPKNITKAQLAGVLVGDVVDYADLGEAPGKLFLVNREPGEPMLDRIEAALPEAAGRLGKAGKIEYNARDAYETLVSRPRTFGFGVYTGPAPAGLTVVAVEGAAPDAASTGWPFTLDLGLVHKAPAPTLVEEFRTFLGTPEAASILKSHRSAAVRP